MRLLEITLPTPAGNVALDEALLLEAEAALEPVEVLRIWEPSSPMVVVGRGSHVAAEVDIELCRRDNVPVLRRSSGGAAIVAAPGCLLYALVLSYRLRPQLRPIDQAHQFVLQTMAAALADQLPGIEPAGISDLAIAGRKVSGNSLRCRRNELLYHGTILYDFDLPLIPQCLAEPPRQPEYRKGRGHESFVTNVPIDPATFAADLGAIFGAAEQTDAESLRGRIRQLRHQRYDVDSWHFRH